MIMLYGIPYLQQKLNQKRPRILTRYLYYEMKNQTVDFGISTPPDLKYWNAVLGWCSKAVDSVAVRLDFHGFREDVFNLGQIYDLNNKDVLFRSAFLGALISACDFIYISEDESGFPRLQVIDGGNATGIINPVTGLLTEGYAVLERDQLGLPLKEAYFTPDYTAYYERGIFMESRRNKAPYALLVPMIFRPDARREFGHSRISRACMSLVGSALRTIKRSEISAEFYSFPQKYATGMDPNIKIDKWAAAMSAMLKISLNSDGQDHVKIGQFEQQSMTPHVEQLKMFAALFAGETGLTLEDLGFVSGNPASYDAIKAAHENLRLTTKDAAKCFSVGIKNAGYLAACVRDDFKYQRQQLYMTECMWGPAFPADVSMLGALGDAAMKLEQSYPGYVTPEKLYELTGI